MGFKATAATLLIGCAALTGACANPGQDLGRIEAKVDNLAAQQKDTLSKLEDLDKGQKDLIVKTAAAARPAAAGPAAEDPNKVYDIPVGKSATRGPADAKVTIVEFSDFQCPFCARSVELIDQITAAYPKDVRVVFKNFPLSFHQQAMPAAKAAIAAGNQGKFWPMHDKIFENSSKLTDASYPLWAKELGLNVEQFNKDMASPEVLAQINEEMKEAAAAGVRGTPTFYINGKKPAGRSLEIYKSIIDEDIKAKS